MLFYVDTTVALEFFHLKTVNESSEFNEFLLDIYKTKTITTCIQI